MSTEQPQPAVAGSIDEAGSVVYAASRIENLTPSAYRLTRDPWGVLTLQGAYQWSQGSDGGHEWRNIPTVQL